MTTEAITPLRQRMIEDMNARKLCAGTQRGAMENRVGRLLQAPLRWSEGSPALSRPLHPPCRHLKSPPDRMQ